MKIMVVDDAAYSRKILCEKLQMLGHQVIEAENGEDAVAKSKSVRPDMVFMDIVMPKMDGISAIKAIRKEIEGKIVVFSANINKSLLAEALKAGASEYILKPFDDVRIEAAVSGFLPTLI